MLAELRRVRRERGGGSGSSGREDHTLELPLGPGAALEQHLPALRRHWPPLRVGEAGVGGMIWRGRADASAPVQRIPPSFRGDARFGRVATVYGAPLPVHPLLRSQNVRQRLGCHVTLYHAVPSCGLPLCHQNVRQRFGCHVTLYSAVI